jgi:hypothetical protein
MDYCIPGKKWILTRSAERKMNIEEEKQLWGITTEWLGKSRSRQSLSECAPRGSSASDLLRRPSGPPRTLEIPPLKKISPTRILRPPCGRAIDVLGRLHFLSAPEEVCRASCVAFVVLPRRRKTSVLLLVALNLLGRTLAISLFRSVGCGVRITLAITPDSACSQDPRVC